MASSTHCDPLQPVEPSGLEDEHGTPQPVFDHVTAQGIRVDFDGLTALDRVALTLRRGEVLGLIGPNGAGKTTLLNVLSGFQRVTRGRVHLGTMDITEFPVHRRASLGLARTFQSGRLFKRLSVLENVEVGAVGAGARRKEARHLAFELLQRVRLDHVASWRSDALPFGEERRLELARAMAMRPYFVLLDEPAAGLNEVETAELATVLDDLRRDFRCGMLVVEHDMDLIMRVCDRIQVLDHGMTIASGTPPEIKANREVIRAYLGS